MKNLVVCFLEDMYASRLATYIRKHYKNEFRVTLSLPGEQNVEMDEFYWLFTDDVALVDRYKNREVLFFDFQDKGEGINPYQPCEQIVRFLLWNQEPSEKSSVETSAKLQVFYTPGGSSTQTLAARQQARSLGETGSCLYIPIKDFCIHEKGTYAYDLSELCYRLQKREELTLQKVLAATEIEDGYVCLRGFHSPLHFVGIGTELFALVRFVLDNCNYKNVVLDLQFLFPGYEEIFALAEEIYSVADDASKEWETHHQECWALLCDGKNEMAEKCKVWNWGEMKENDIT